jgi:hypothetical protein
MVTIRKERWCYQATAKNYKSIGLRVLTSDGEAQAFCLPMVGSKKFHALKLA